MKNDPSISWERFHQISSEWLCSIEEGEGPHSPEDQSSSSYPSRRYHILSLCPQEEQNSDNYVTKVVNIGSAGHRKFEVCV
jgi:hypothetical protein